MPLSIAKFETTLTSRGFIPSKYFTIDGEVMFVELFSEKLLTTFLLYIPSKYSMDEQSGEGREDRQGRGESRVMLQLKYINVNDSYTSVKDESIRKAYEETIDLSGKFNPESSYRKCIMLSDMSSADVAELSSIYRQISRLRYTIQGLDYRIGIQFKNYLIVIRRDMSIECFAIKHHPRNPQKRLFVVPDLEILYHKGSHMIEDILTIEGKIKQVVLNTYDTNLANLTRVAASISTAEAKLAQSKEQEGKIVRSIERLVKVVQTIDDGIASLSPRLTIVSEIGPVRAEIARLEGLREESIDMILALRSQYDTMFLQTDSILFDNSIMLERVLENLGKFADRG